MRRCLNCMEEYPDQHGNTCPYCGFTEGEKESQPSSLRPGSILQRRYIVGNVIKAREQDLTYIGWDALFERKVQIQEYYPKKLAERKEGLLAKPYPDGEESYREGLKNFYSRSRELLRLYQEEDIVTYFACFEENGTAYGVMDYQKRETLGHRLQGRPVKPETAMGILQKAMAAVGKIHRIGIYHGMVGIDTFWITSQDKLIAKDFGGWLLSVPESGEEGLVGQRSEEAGVREDIWGLARMFCRLVTGREILNSHMLEEALRSDRKLLGKAQAAALGRALDRKLQSLEQFQAELSQGEGAKAAIPLPLVIGGAVIAAAVIIIAVLILGGIV